MFYQKIKDHGYSRQYALDRSSSEYVMFVDSDDTLQNTFALKNVCNFIEENSNDVVYTKMVDDYFGNKSCYCVGFDVLHSKVYRRSFIKNKKIRFPYIYNSEDIAFNNLVILNTDNIGYCDEVLYEYKRRMGSLTQTSDYAEKKHIKCYCESLNYVIKIAEQLNINKELIGKLMVSSFSYFSYYFNKNLNDPSIENIYKLVPYYDKYEPYSRNCQKKYWLDFWTIKVENECRKNEFAKFISFCREQ